MVTERRNYTVDDLQQLFTDLNYTDGYDMWLDTKDLIAAGMLPTWLSVSLGISLLASAAVCPMCYTVHFLFGLSKQSKPWCAICLLRNIDNIYIHERVVYVFAVCSKPTSNPVIFTYILSLMKSIGVLENSEIW